MDRNPSLRFTYQQWETLRKKDWGEVLKKSRPKLTLRISTECNFYDALESYGVFTKRTIENFRVSLDSSTFDLVYLSKLKCQFTVAQDGTFKFTNVLRW